MPPKFLGSQLIRLGPSIWPISDFGANGTPRSGVKTQGGETVIPERTEDKVPRRLAASVSFYTQILAIDIACLLT